MPKRKGHFHDTAKFVSDHSIETCVRQLEQLQSEDVHIEMLDISSDCVRFRVRAYERGRLRVEGRGTLLRWEGTHTRVDCHLKIREGILAFTLLMLVIFVMVVNVIPAFSLLVTGVDTRLLLLFSAGFLILIVGLLRLINHLALPDDVPINLMGMIETTLR